jgi:TolB-like protein
MTRDGSTVGTAAYMSPEQLRGETVGPQTDIWSLGVILYEMVAGHLPFRGEFEQGMIYSILNDAPRSVSGALPEVLKTILQTALQKNPLKRYHSMTELLAPLSALSREGGRSITKRRRWLLPAALIAVLALGTFLLRGPVGSLFAPSGATGSGLASIAVLPFADNSPQKDQEYFCNGIAEELVTALVRIPDLKVVSRTRALSPTERGKSAREIGRELGVGTVLEGSVRNAGGRLRITVGLVDVADGSQRWSEQYDREMTDIIGLQENVARSVAAALRINLAPQTAETMLPRKTKNPLAY